jgi:septum formation protein
MNLPTITLASKSPRRKQILTEAGFDVEVKIKEVEEVYPEDLDPYKIPVYLAELKAQAFRNEITDELVVTSDTIVILDGTVLGKPQDEKDAFQMLKALSGRKHDVVTGVCIFQKAHSRTFSELTEVYFKDLSDVEISYYVDNFKPLDKAGSYGIQEWIGMIGVEKIVGSYFNVMGFPINRFYSELRAFTGNHFI